MQHATSHVSGELRLLVAEDDDELRETLVHWFNMIGFRACGVASGDEFFARTEPIILDEKGHWVPDVILTDLCMPGIPPLEILDGLARLRVSIPVVIISGVQDEAVRRRALELGASWVAKPFGIQQLAQLVRRVCTPLRRVPRAPDFDDSKAGQTGAEPMPVGSQAVH